MQVKLERILMLPILAGCLSLAPLAVAPNATVARAQDATTVGTIPTVAAQAGSFNTLVAALEAADLVEALGGPGPFTVFAPTDEAFAALPAGTVEQLLKPENKATLVKVLSYHVIPARVPSSMVRTGTVATLSGTDTVITVRGDQIAINDATVIQADVNASNGVIHVIDKVLIPGEL